MKNKKRLVFFTEIVTVLSEAGEKRLKEAIDNIPNSENDLDFYDRLGLKPPKDLNTSDISEDGLMSLKEGEYDYEFVTLLLDISNFSSASESSEIGTIIQLNDDKKYLVEEDIYEVYDMIKYAQMNWFEKIINYFK